MYRAWIISIAAALMALPVFALAADGFVPLIGLPGITDSANSTQAYFDAIYKFSIIAAAFLAVIKIIFAGVQYMITDLVNSKEQAKKDIQGALLGLLIVLGAVLILNTINPNLTEFTLFKDVPTPINTGTRVENDKLPPAKVGDRLVLADDVTEAERENFKRTCAGTINETIDASTGKVVLLCDRDAAPDTTVSFNCSGSNCTCVAENPDSVSECVTKCKVRSNYLSHSVSGNTVQCQYQEEGGECKEIVIGCCARFVTGESCAGDQFNPACSYRDIEPAQRCWFR